ncbi:MAG: cupin domain-containing protein [Chloroflexota bacterium]
MSSPITPRPGLSRRSLLQAGGAAGAAAVLAAALPGTVLAAARSGAAGAATGRNAETTPDPVGISRAAFGSALPDTAPGLRLGLWEVVLPADTAAAPHTHAGTQIVYVVSGTQGYHVHTGSVELTRKDGTTQTFGDGETFELSGGDWIVETPGMEHEAWNAGPDPVISMAATLYPDGVPVSISVPVEAVAPVG